MAACKIVVTVAAVASVGANNPSSAPVSACRRPPRHPWMAMNSSTSNTEHSSALTARGGGAWGRSKPQQEMDQPSGEEYEYEYEYDDADEGGDAEIEAEWEYADYEDGEYGWDEENVQGIDGNFIDSDDAESTTAVAVEQDEVVDAEGVRENDDARTEPPERDGRDGNGRPYRAWGKRVVSKEEEDMDSYSHEDSVDADSKSDSEDVVENEGDGAEDDDDEDYLFTTPIPKARKSDDDPARKLRVANRTVPKSDMDMDDGNDDEYEEDEEVAQQGEDDGEDTQEGAEYDDEDVEDYLYETPIARNEKSVSVPRKARGAASKPNNPAWWQQLTEKKRQPGGRGPWRPASSSNASFIAPLFYSGAPRSFSLRSSDGRPFYAEWASSLSGAIVAVVRPIGNGFQSITYTVASTFSRLLSNSWYLVRHSFDFLWWGPVDGVTTTGIPTRDGGLSTLLLSTPVVMVVSSIIIVGLIRVMITKELWRDRGTGGMLGKRESPRFDAYNDEEDEYYDEDPSDPLSVEEELEFLNREFDAANPSSKDRIAESIVTKRNKFAFSPSGGGDRARRGQRQFTIKSIQNWWKERPRQQSIAIIEPQHLRNQQQPLGQEIKRLQKQLTVSEQERAILKQDVQRLQHRLQKTQQDARSIVGQNRWLEKQTTKADHILTKAVEVERRKANEEMGRVRESMRGVLERERMLMRGRIASQNMNVRGRNDLDLDEQPPSRYLDGVKIVREADEVNEDDDGGDAKWTAL